MKRISVFAAFLAVFLCAEANAKPDLAYGGQQCGTHAQVLKANFDRGHKVLFRGDSIFQQKTTVFYHPVKGYWLVVIFKLTIDRACNADAGLTFDDYKVEKGQKT